jgi:hypothetical protein
MTRLVQIQVVEMKNFFGARFDGGRAFFNPGAITDFLVRPALEEESADVRRHLANLL